MYRLVWNTDKKVQKGRRTPTTSLLCQRGSFHYLAYHSSKKKNTLIATPQQRCVEEASSAAASVLLGHYNYYNADYHRRLLTAHAVVGAGSHQGFSEVAIPPPSFDSISPITKQPWSITMVVDYARQNGRLRISFIMVSHLSPGPLQKLVPCSCYTCTMQQPHCGVMLYSHDRVCRHGFGPLVAFKYAATTHVKDEPSFLSKHTQCPCS